MIQILCNGKERAIEEHISIAHFIETLGLEAGPLVVECDGEVVRPEEYEDRTLRDGNVVELIRFVGGG